MPHKRGFTLIELLVVISIVGVLSAVGLSVFSQGSVKARDGVRKSDLRQIQQALELYYEKDRQYPVGNEDNCVEIDEAFNTEKLSNYLKDVPKDPKRDSHYCYIGDESNYQIRAILENKEDSDIANSQKQACQTNPNECLYILTSNSST